jgi:hypothetical protein
MSDGSQVGDVRPREGWVPEQGAALHRTLRPSAKSGQAYPLLPAFCGTGFALPLWAVNVPPIFMHDPFATSFQAFP